LRYLDGGGGSAAITDFGFIAGFAETSPATPYY
jgi:hypothetical protein